MNKKSVIKKILFAAKNVAFFVKPADDVDSLAGALALAHLIKKRGGQASVYSDHQTSGVLAFLDPDHIIRQKLLAKKILQISIPDEEGQIRGITYKKTPEGLQIRLKAKNRLPAAKSVKIESRSEVNFDLIVAVGVSNLKELAATFFDQAELFYQTTIINLNYRADGKEFGKVDLINLKYRSSSELVFDLLNDWDPGLIDQQVASDLLAGLLSSTQSFQKRMVSPTQFDLAADLIERGANRAEVIRQLYKTKNLNKLKLWGQILSELKTRGQGRIVWSVARFNNLISANNNQSNLMDLLQNYLGHTPKTQLGAIFVLISASTPRDQDATAPHKKLDAAAKIKHADNLGPDTLIRAIIAAPNNIDALSVAKKMATGQGDANIARVNFTQRTLRQAINQFIEIGELFLRSSYNIRTKNHGQLPAKTEQTIAHQKSSQTKT